MSVALTPSKDHAHIYTPSLSSVLRATDKEEERSVSGAPTDLRTHKTPNMEDLPQGEQ